MSICTLNSNEFIYVNLHRSSRLEADETLVLVYPKKTSLEARLHLENFPVGSEEHML